MERGNESSERIMECANGKKHEPVFFPWDLQKEDLKITVLPIQKETVFSRLFWVKESGMHGNKTLRELDPVKRDRFQCHGLLVVSLNT